MLMASVKKDENGDIVYSEREALVDDLSPVAQFTDSSCTTIQTNKSGKFKVVAYTFSTYDEASKVIDGESESEKLARMLSGEKIFTVSDASIDSISSSTYVGTSANVYFKDQNVKAYLTYSGSTLSGNNINLGMLVKPQTTTGQTPLIIVF
jgi:hypothetical protein